jgi:branched-chain amino acid transport system permease protein
LETTVSFFLQQTINGLVVGSAFALYASGFSLVIANLKVFHMAHAGVFTWAAIVSYELTSKWDWPFWAALPVVAVVAGLLNVACYWILLRHLERRRDREMAAFISSLGGFIVLAQAANIHLHQQAVGIRPESFSLHVWRFAGLQISAIQLTMLVLAVVLFGFLKWLVDRTQLGREIKAVSFDARTSKLLGINVDRTNSIVFFISGAMAGVSAALIAVAYKVVDSDVGATYLVLAIAVMVIGGFGSVVGVAVGGFLVGLCSSYTTAYISSGMQELVVFIVLLLVLVVRPSGLFAVPTADSRA